MNYWEVIADNLKKRGWSWSCVSAVDSEGRRIWIADAYRDGKRFVVHADEIQAAFLELDAAVRNHQVTLETEEHDTDNFHKSRSV